MVRTFIITGNTWSSRADLRKLGGSWVPHLAAWLLPDYEQDSLSRLRQDADLDVRLVTLPIDLPYSSRAAYQARAASAVSPTPSPSTR
jgi:hypothetical protein